MIAATGQPRVKQDFEPIPLGFVHIPYDDLAALEKQVTSKTCAVLLEPVQGEGGVRFPKEDYLKEVRRICDANQALLLFDEVQTGLGRTGKLFAYEHSGIEPDALTLAKSLGTGIPIGACIAKREVSQVFEPGDHASTFGGNFLVCEVAKAFLGMLIDGGLLQQVNRVGDYFLESLQKLKKKYQFILEVRGKGLMIGANLAKPGKEIVEAALKRGLIINCTQETVLRFVPPLILTEKEVDEGLAILDQVFQDAGGK